MILSKSPFYPPNHILMPVIINIVYLIKFNSTLLPLVKKQWLNDKSLQGVYLHVLANFTSWGAALNTYCLQSFVDPTVVLNEVEEKMFLIEGVSFCIFRWYSCQKHVIL
jgi:hypothetical protein